MILNRNFGNSNFSVSVSVLSLYYMNFTFVTIEGFGTHFDVTITVISIYISMHAKTTVLDDEVFIANSKAGLS